MAYQKRNFKKDQLLTADDLNAMDDQIASNEESAKKANDDIKNKLDKSAVVKEKGNSETAVMSQAAATKEFDELSEEIYHEEILKWESGGVNATNGQVTYDTGRIRTPKINTSDGTFAIKANKGYKFTVYAYDNETYIGSLRNGEFVNSTGADWLTYFNLFAYPLTYQYRFVGANETESADIDPDIAKSEFILRRANFTIKNDDGEKQQQTGIRNISELTSGEVYQIKTTGEVKTNIFAVEETGAVYEKEEYHLTTDFIKCPPYLLIDFEDSTARLVLYFYDLVNGEYVPRWDLLRIVNSENELNRLTRSRTRNRIIEIPDGVYMKAGLAVDGNAAIYGWSGVHVGCEMSSTTYTPIANETGGFSDVPMDGKRSGITIPGSARLLWLKDACLIHLWGIAEDGTKTHISDKDYFQVKSLPIGYKYFRADISLDFKSPIDDSGLASLLTKKTFAVNMNDTINCACDYSVVKPYGRALEVINHARDISEIEWECKADKAINSSDAHVFSAGTKYKGVPYGSQWMKPYYFGWHITKHTFLNAANDEDSIFYKETARTGRSTGYGTVCSAFATLCQGFPYPVVTRGFLRDPHIIRTITNTPQAGTVMYDGGGHTVIPETTGNGKEFSQYTIYESVSPITLRRSCFDFIDNDQHNTLAWSYINPYIYAIHHDAEVGYPNAYNVVDGTITNGTARPYRGDRGVYTSDDDVKISIKDSTATKCFVQRCSFDVSNNTFIPTTEAVITVDFSAGTKQIVLDKSLLRDGIYGVYTDKGDTMEYFEYRTAPVATYSMSDDNFMFSVGTGENLLSDVVIADKTNAGIVYIGNGSSCTITGVATGTSFNTFLSSPTALPSGFIPGATYTAGLDGAQTVCMRIGFYTPTTTEFKWSINVRGVDVEFTIPEDAIGMAIRLHVYSDDVGKQIDETVTPIIKQNPKPWYSVWWQDDVPSGITEIIPHEPSGDYREYRKVYNPNGATGAMFFKGTLGAYKTTLTFKET